MLFLSLLLGKISLFLIQKIKGSSGSTWPGHLVIESNNNFIKQMLRKNKTLKVILIAGTNGKTTTTKALDHILNRNGVSVIRNDSGANLLNGLASTLVKHSDFSGRIKSDALLFEVDENSLPLILSELNNPDALILLNLFRDQLDRYGEVNITSEKWASSLKKLSSSTVVISNADDPQIAFMSKNLKANTMFYSVIDNLKTEEKVSHAADSIVCPNCRHSLEFSKVSYSHLGNYTCPSCHLSNPKSFSTNISTPIKGVFNIYNLTAAVLASHVVFGINAKNATESLTNFIPAFGRQEEIEVDGKRILLLLSKNPTGFNESLKVVNENNYTTLLFLLNDRIPDGRDISWIWDVDFNILKKNETTLFVGGDRAYDLANRLSYDDLNVSVNDNLNTILKKAIDNTPKDKTLAILPTYSAMLEVRKILLGKSIL